jgi:phage FluMu protein Com
MRVITIQCPACGTVVAENALERYRVLECPGLDCDRMLRFDSLPTENREYVREHIEQYQV